MLSYIKNTLKNIGNTIKILKRDYRDFMSVAGFLDYVTSAAYQSVYRDSVKSLISLERVLKQEILDVEKGLSNLKKDEFYFENLSAFKSRLNELESELYRVKNSPLDFVSLGKGIDGLVFGSIDMYSPHRLEGKLAEQKKVLKKKLKTNLKILEKSCSEYEKALSKAKLDPEKIVRIESIFTGFMWELDCIFSDDELDGFLGPILRRIKKELSKEMKIRLKILN